MNQNAVGAVIKRLDDAYRERVSGWWSGYTRELGEAIWGPVKAQSEPRLWRKDGEILSKVSVWRKDAEFVSALWCHEEHGQEVISTYRVEVVLPGERWIQGGEDRCLWSDQGFFRPGPWWGDYELWTTEVGKRISAMERQIGERIRAAARADEEFEAGLRRAWNERKRR